MMTTTVLTPDPRQRAELLAREHVHLVCPCCEWIVTPVDALIVDRLQRLIAHLDDHRTVGLPELRIALAAYDRAMSPPPADDPYCPTGDAW